jgi:hypothetical protein
VKPRLFALALVLAIGIAAACAPQGSTATGTPGRPTPSAIHPAASGASPAPGEAIYEGAVVDASTNSPIVGATVAIQPWALQSITDAAGHFEFDGLVIGSGVRCRWATITVSANGFGTLKRIDEPFTPFRLTASLALTRQDVTQYVGPSVAAPSPSSDYCVR